MEIWRHRVLGLGSVAALALLLLLALFQSFTLNKIAEDAPPTLGAIEDWPGAENDHRVADLACFAVSEHNSKTNALLEFQKVVKVKKQVVEGMAYYITIQVSESGAKKLYEAKVWERLWLD